MKVLYTTLKARLTFIRSSEGNYNWFFLPGGPGLGSESLRDLTALLNLPGTMWHLDLPGDGSNRTENDAASFSRWSEALVEAVKLLPNVILVGHSSGGMFALATPHLKKLLKGFVLIGSAPDAGWQKAFMEYIEKHPVSDPEKIQAAYAQDPSDENLKKFTLVSIPYFSMEKNTKKMIALLNELPVNAKVHAWSEQYFDSTYKAAWCPDNMPTLILAGEYDCITPLHLFSDCKEYHRDNVLMCSIKNAAHFPWIDNPKEVTQAFMKYIEMLS